MQGLLSSAHDIKLQRRSVQRIIARPRRLSHLLSQFFLAVFLAHWFVQRPEVEATIVVARKLRWAVLGAGARLGADMCTFDPKAQDADSGRQVQGRPTRESGAWQSCGSHIHFGVARGSSANCLARMACQRLQLAFPVHIHPTDLALIPLSIKSEQKLSTNRTPRRRGVGMHPKEMGVSRVPRWGAGILDLANFSRSHRRGRRPLGGLPIRLALRRWIAVLPFGSFRHALRRCWLDLCQGGVSRCRGFRL
mmetsp:Transcript_17684/g.67268  ORF Transcript_17684/g.67268 Transcript_17684/m.67268 type:complete len:250 (-) Transcript_17684:2029-2778(-)